MPEQSWNIHSVMFYFASTACRNRVGLLQRECQGVATVSKTDDAPDLLPASLPQGGSEQRPPVQPAGPFVRFAHVRERYER